jgi:hypothetical protein
VHTADFWYRGMQVTKNLISIYHEDSVITYSHVMYIAKYISETEVQVFWNMILCHWASGF